jgi:hypothetical protein
LATQGHPKKKILGLDQSIGQAEISFCFKFPNEESISLHLAKYKACFGFSNFRTVKKEFFFLKKSFPYPPPSPLPKSKTQANFLPSSTHFSLTFLLSTTTPP